VYVALGYTQGCPHCKASGYFMRDMAFKEGGLLPLGSYINQKVQVYNCDTAAGRKHHVCKGKSGFPSMSLCVRDRCVEQQPGFDSKNPYSILRTIFSTVPFEKLASGEAFQQVPTDYDAVETMDALTQMVSYWEQRDKVMEELMAKKSAEVPSDADKHSNATASSPGNAHHGGDEAAGPVKSDQAPTGIHGADAGAGP